MGEDDAESRYAAFTVEAYSAKENLFPALFEDGPSTTGSKREASAESSPSKQRSAKGSRRESDKEKEKAARSMERHAARDAADQHKAAAAAGESPHTPSSAPQEISSPFSPTPPRTPSAYDLNSVRCARNIQEWRRLPCVLYLGSHAPKEDQ